MASFRYSSREALSRRYCVCSRLTRHFHAEYTERQSMPSFVVLTVQSDAVPLRRCWRFIAPPDNINGAVCVKACVIASPHDKTQCVSACRSLLACRTEVSSRIFANAGLQAVKTARNCFSSSIQALFWNVNHPKTYHHQWRTQHFFSGGGFNKFSSGQRAESTGIWGR
jgi:hypothetical protein